MALLVATLLAAILPGSSLAMGGTGAITGTVYGPNGMPAGGVWVSACSTACEFAEAAANGTYTVGTLDAGNYRVGVEDYTGALPGGYATATGLTTDQTQAALVAVTTTPVTFDVHVPAGRVISGSITSQAAVGVSSAFVAACLDSPLLNTQSFWVCGYDVAQPDGSYSLAVLPGRYAVYAEDSGDVLASGYYSTAGYTFAYRQATILPVAAVDLAGISIALPPGASISGTVTNDAGPVAAISAQACTLDLQGCRVAFTAGDGSYTVAGLPAGSYELLFRDSSGLNPGGYYGATGYTYESGQAATIALGASGASGIDVRLPVGHLVSGVVRTSAGAPAAVGVEDCTTKVCMAVTTTAADGTYVMNLAPGQHTIHASDYTGKNVSGFYATAGLANNAHAAKVTVAAADLAGINLKLGKITGSVHPGTAHSGKYTSSTVVRKGTYVTTRFLVGKLFAGTKISIMRSSKNSAGTWSAYKRVATVVVASDGYAYYSTKPSGYMAFKASLTDKLVIGVTYLSPPVYARGK